MWVPIVVVSCSRSFSSCGKNHHNRQPWKFGDSITQQGFGWPPSSVGWGSLLSRDDSRRADVLNRGFSGYNTGYYAVEILPSILPQKDSQDAQEVLFATACFGANDVAPAGELQHIPIDTYGHRLVSSIQEYEVTVILRTPPPIDVETWYKERGYQKDESARPS